MKTNVRILLLVILYVIGTLAFLGGFILVELSKSGSYSSDMVTRDLIKSAIVSLISLGYPIYFVLKNRPKSD